MSDYTKLKGVFDISELDLLTELENNIKMYLDWALLRVGGWIDVNRPQQGVWGGDEHILRCVEEPSYSDGQVWEGFRKDWVWEDGLPRIDQPIEITQVYIDGVGYSSDDANYGWHINYPLGRVIFDSPISADREVTCSYSYRWAQIYLADNAPWWTELQYRSHRTDDPSFKQKGKGDWSIGSHNRIQMPSVVIESAANGEARGYELGNASLILEQDLYLNVLAENRSDRNKLLDYFRNQKDKTIWLYNTQSLVTEGDYPLDYRGMKVGEKMYPDIIDDHKWKKCFIDDAVIRETESWSPHLFEGSVLWRVEVKR